MPTLQQPSKSHNVQAQIFPSRTLLRNSTPRLLQAFPSPAHDRPRGFHSDVLRRSSWADSIPALPASARYFRTATTFNSLESPPHPRRGVAGSRVHLWWRKIAASKLPPRKHCKSQKPLSYHHDQPPVRHDTEVCSNERTEREPLCTRSLGRRDHLPAHHGPPDHVLHQPRYLFDDSEASDFKVQTSQTSSSRRMPRFSNPHLYEQPSYPHPGQML